MAGQPHFSAVRSSSSHVLFPSFGRAYASTIPLHFVTVIRSLYAPFHFAESSLFPFTTFQPYCVCRPQCFQRLLLRPAIGVGSTPFLLRFPFLKTLHFDYKIPLLISFRFAVDGRFALNQGTPPKKAVVFYCFPAVSRCYPFSPLRKLRSVLGLAWLFDCRNTATALLIHSAIIPLSLHFSSIPCGAWGCLITLFSSNIHILK